MKLPVSYKVGLFALLALIMMLDTGCRYEDGPFMAFRSRQKRMVNSWQYEKAFRNGLDVTTGQTDTSINYSISTIGFNDENRFSTIIHYVDGVLDSMAVSERYDGTWEFQDNDKAVVLLYDLPSPPSGSIQKWTVTRLKEHSMWAEEQIGDNIFEYRFIPTP